MPSTNFSARPLGPIERHATGPDSYVAEVLTGDEWQSVRMRLGLSRRELEAVQGIFLGKKISTIATDMELSLGTVKTYMQRVYHKLQVCDQRELTLAVLRASSRWQPRASTRVGTIDGTDAPSAPETTEDNHPGRNQ